MHNGRAERIRLWGIDCPEKRQPFGPRASQVTGDLAFGKAVKVIVHDVDRYGRTVREAAASSRAPSALKAGLGPRQSSSSTSVNSARSVLRVPRVRNSNALARRSGSVWASLRALATLTCQARESSGIDSRWPNRARTVAVDLGPQPGSPG